MLRGFWYIAGLSRALAKGATKPVTLLGDELLIGRRPDGQVFAYSDRCPHRGMPMRHGSFDGTNLQCCYHGWQFSAENGVCIHIPALADADPTQPGRFRLRSYPCRDVQGNVWVYIPAGRTLPNTLPDVPQVPGFDGIAPQIATTMRFPSNADIAAYGFCDPAHPAFVHTSRWWKSKAGLKLRPKKKAFEPAHHGFRMKSHQLSGGARPYRLMGTDVQVDVTIGLPGLRIEHIRGSRHSACVLAAVTPVTETTTDVHYCVYWTMPWLAPLRPFAAWMARDFLSQDLDMAAKLAHGAATPPMLFVGDPDIQIAWLMRLKREYLASQVEDRPFVNPLTEQVLEWKS
ncbi:Rieske 2Fe-2S domain-containing protein [Acidisphaera sp. L21]|uniref:Rieske 2Fe-2S domain-containing protein n=1 Tax=Acidisphaera sp. L21 TaxID=1641851 RepID=UPI00211075E9|nr:Rieske 2Fe-2S domain-containing protein [Acidisphaera sp. L21]